MDMTPDELRKVTFRSTTLAKGYSVTDVDEFVEQVAAGIGELIDLLRHATERAARAEGALSEAKSSEETVQRTLVHAQKLADAVLAEARQEAAAIQSEAVETANRTRSKAREEGAAHVAKAREARTDAEHLRSEATVDRDQAKAEKDSILARATENIDAELLGEVQRLHGVRATLEADVIRLGEWLEEQRAAVRRLLVEAMNVVEGPALSIAEAPLVEPVVAESGIFGSELASSSGDDQRTAAVAVVSIDGDDGESEVT